MKRFTFHGNHDGTPGSAVILTANNADKMSALPARLFSQQNFTEKHGMEDTRHKQAGSLFYRRNTVLSLEMYSFLIAPGG